MNATRSRFLSCDRRRFLRTGLGATLGLTASRRLAGSTARSQGASPGGSWLLVIPDTLATGNYSGKTVAVFDPGGQELATLDVPGISGLILPTGDPRLAIVEMSKTVTLLHLDTCSTQMVDYRFPEGQVMFVADPRGRYGEPHARWSLVTVFGDMFDTTMRPQLVLLDLERAAGQDLVPMLPTEAQQAPLSHQFASDGEHIVTWDEPMPSLFDDDSIPASIPRAVLIPTADPASNRELTGAHPDWHSGGAAFSPDATLVAYTMYDPESLEGKIVLEPLGGDDVLTVADADDLGRVFWLPGEATRMLTIARGEVALHELDSSGSVSSTTLDDGDIRADLPVQIAPDGRALVYGLADDADAPASWRRLDLATGETTALDALDGLRPLPTSGVDVRPRWLLFATSDVFGYDPLVSLDVAEGTTARIAELFPWPDDATTSDDGRFAVLGTSWDSQYPASLVDLQTGTLTKLWAVQTQMVRSGVVSPDGARAAIIAVGNEDSALETLLIDPVQPDEPEHLSAGAAVLWTADH